MEKERIKELRKALCLSWEGLAQELGVSWRTVARWEKGEAVPPERALKILRDLAVRADLRPPEETIGQVIGGIRQTLEAHGLTPTEGEVKAIEALARRLYKRAVRSREGY